MPRATPAAILGARMSNDATRECTLHQAIGEAVPCTGATCSFWSDADAACVFSRVEFELLAEPDLARHLLALRTQLEEARNAQRDEARRRFYGRLNWRPTTTDDPDLAA